MNAVATPVTVHRPLAAEEAARADFYALLSRLFQAAPDGSLLHALADSEPLAAGGAGRGPATLQEQRRFFQSHLAPAWPGLVEAATAAAKANYYRRVAALAAAFLAIETESFELD